MGNNHSGKKFLVVGASSGIGAAIAKTLASEGAALTIMARRIEKLESVRCALKGVGHAVAPFDVARLDSIRGELESLTHERGPWDGLVYSAGIGEARRLKDLTPQSLQAVMQVNFLAFVEFVRCLMAFKPKGNAFRIVAISSLAAICNDKYYTAYAASKAAMDAAVRCLSRELANKNVTINSIRPGVVDVERLRGMEDLTGGLDNEIRKNGYQPLGIIPPSDIAEMASWLLSESACRISGVSFPFNGGAAC